MHEVKKDNNQFYIGDNIENFLAKVTYVPTGEDKIIIDHTIVSETLKGQGVGGILVKKVIDLAREENKKIIPLCPFAKHFMSKTDEYNDVLLDPSMN